MDFDNDLFGVATPEEDNKYTMKVAILNIYLKELSREHSL